MLGECHPYVMIIFGFDILLSCNFLLTFSSAPIKCILFKVGLWTYNFFLASSDCLMSSLSSSNPSYLSSALFMFCSLASKFIYYACSVQSGGSGENVMKSFFFHFPVRNVHLGIASAFQTNRCLLLALISRRVNRSLWNRAHDLKKSKTFKARNLRG
ncbi:hypothetical protein GGU11DRAFT_214126 [Lentinula aff. detonsa]|nr:hypothetical protein GGU11DRAFT_214126 [Lentinula aff. detonsa]